jgi:hypothetical protein
VHDSTSTAYRPPAIFTKPFVAQDLYKIIVCGARMQK